MVEDVTDLNYEELIKSPAVVVAYGIASCAPCAAYDPVLEHISNRYDHVRVGKAKMHVPGRCRTIKKIHQFETYPTTHFFSDGNLLLTREGKLEEEDLDHLIAQYFPAPSS